MDDLREHLDASIGDGPAHRDLAPLLAAGHRAVRRRRIAAGAGALALVAVVGTTYAVAGGRPDAARDPQVTHSGTASAGPTPGPESPLVWNRDELVRYSSTADDVLVRPGVQVLDRVDDYLHGLSKYDGSVAMDITYRGHEYWVTVAWQADGVSGTGMTEPSDGWADFRAWVADQAAANGVEVPGGSGYPDLVSVRPDGTFDVVGQAQLLDQTTSDLPDGFDRAARLELDGSRYLVLARTIDGRPDLVTVHAEPHGHTLDALLAYARDKYASGEGVR